jgi:hypothetical protein
VKEPFDPWAATLDEWLAHFDGDTRAEETFDQFGRAVAIAKAPADPKDWSGRDVLQAVANCAHFGLAMPTWLASQYLRRFRWVVAARAPSWDHPRVFGEAFPGIGRPRPTGVQLFVLRQKMSAVPALERFFSTGNAKRNPAGYAAAANELGLTVKQVRTWLPKTRRNMRGSRANPKRELAELEEIGRALFGKGKVPQDE